MAWGGFDWLGQRIFGDAASRAGREAHREYLAPTYGVSFKSVLIVVLVLVALIVGAFVIFT